MKARYTLKEIRNFFAMRMWARPDDWCDIEKEAISNDRRDYLSAWMAGYLTARPASNIKGINP